jgi:TRAP-type transport system small permease protein
MQAMKQIDKLFKTGALISLVAMIAVVAIQVFTRFLMDSTPHWTEEAARIFFIYSVAFGTGTGIKNGDFIRLDLIGKYLSAKNDRLLDLLIDAIVIVFSIILIVHSIKFVRLGMDELSPALEIPMGFVFLSIAVIGLSIAVFTFAKLFQTLTNKI